LEQRIVIVLILGWLLLAAQWLRDGVAAVSSAPKS
jgi:hypothetical protein